MIQNVLSIDLEDYYCANNLDDIINNNDWEKLPSSLIQNTEKILSLLKKYKIQATFFVLGWIAERYPELITNIEDHGHEIASHGYSHQMVTNMDRKSFEQDLQRSLITLKRCVRQPIIGYRAPSFTITPNTLWAIDILKENGFQYDSSIFPTSFHKVYGFRSSQLSIHTIEDKITEIPISCIKFLGYNIPCSGGAYFRILPYFISRMLFTQQNRLNKPVIFYLHPWEIDPAQPRYQLPFFKSFRHYYGLSRTYYKFEHLLQDFSFTSIRNILWPK